MSRVAIYLAGAIQKGHESVKSHWCEKSKDRIRRALPHLEVIFLDPQERKDDLGDSFTTFGRDLLQVTTADIIFVDARDRRGLGVGAEMMWAKVLKKPLLIWAPENSHYNRRDTSLLGVPLKEFIHPFVYTLADQLVEDPEEGALWIERYLNGDHPPIKGSDVVYEAMDAYRDTQLESDLPMKELLDKLDSSVV